MAVVAWSINTYFVKLHATPGKSLLYPMFLVSPFYVLLYFTFGLESFLGEVIAKAFLVVTLSIILFWVERKSIILLLKTKAPKTGNI
jgi:hypothetical protein